MGEVYRATDTKLNRDVALKILPQQFASDSQRMARFQREAEVLASLDHPNIGQIYGIEEAGQTKALVLQLIEGPTLAERIDEGPIPVEEALKIALQMAEGLEAAHEKGVIHRDLKPANIKINPEGQVKILDFGLAKALEGETPPDSSLSQSPTLTAAATQAGVILGTAAYMSPEQAKGKPVDKRADIFAFGAVLYECLTGKRAFEGDDASEIIASVIKVDINWDKLPEDTPAVVKRWLRRCLQANPKQRLHDMGDVRIEIRDYLADPSAYEGGVTAEAMSDRRRLVPWLLASVVVTVIVTLIAVEVFWSPLSGSLPVRRFTVDLGLKEPFGVEGFSAHVALSPDGTRLVYAANVDGATRLLMRPMDQLEAQPIPGTDDANWPFFSPDGEWVGFFTGVDNKLKKVSLSGGSPVTLCDAPRFGYGGSWGADGTIVFATLDGLFGVSASGGTPQRLTTPNVQQGEFSHRFPEILPGGNSVLFQIDSQTRSAADSNIAVLSLQTGEYRTLIEGGDSPRYTPTGHVVFGRAGALLAVPFDLSQLVKTGAEAPILRGIQADNRYGSAPFSISSDGLLVYVPGGGVTTRSLVWVDREGNEEPLAEELNSSLQPRVSPDGTRLAISIDSSGNEDVWIYDLARQSLSRLTFDPARDNFPGWTPDGRRVVFSSTRDGGQPNLYWKASDGTGQVERLTTSPNTQFRPSFSPDSEKLVFVEVNPETLDDIHVLLMEDEPQSQPLLHTAFSEIDPVISPDGRWIAYESLETGKYEVYIRPFPNVETGKWMISRGGGVDPVWSPDGRELFYYDGPLSRVMAVPIETEPAFSAGSPVLLFTGDYIYSQGRHYDIHPDGQRFLMIKEAEQTANKLNVVLNWFEELKRLVPTE